MQPDPKTGAGGVGPPKAVGERRGSIGGGSGGSGQLQQQQQQQQQPLQPLQLEGSDRIRFLVQVHCTHTSQLLHLSRVTHCCICHASHTAAAAAGSERRQQERRRRHGVAEHGLGLGQPGDVLSLPQRTCDV